MFLAQIVFLLAFKFGGFAAIPSLLGNIQVLAIYHSDYSHFYIGELLYPFHNLPLTITLLAFISIKIAWLSGHELT